MPHSLRAKLSGLRYKGILEDKDYKRLCKALDNEGVIDNLRAEMYEYITHSPYVKGFMECCRLRDDVMRIIDKYEEKGAISNDTRGSNKDVHE